MREGVRLHRAWAWGLALVMVSVGGVDDGTLGDRATTTSVGDVVEVALGELFTKLPPTLVGANSSNWTGLNGFAPGLSVLNFDFF